jgi:hypothetical protein
MSQQPQQHPALTDVFTTIAGVALSKHGVTDPNWVQAIAGEYRTAFAQLGITLPPPGLVELLPEDAPAAPGEDLDMSPKVVIPAASAGPSVDPAEMSAQWRVLMLLALLESPEVDSMGFTAHPHNDGQAGYCTAIVGPGFALLVEWRNRGRGRLEWARLLEVWLPRVDHDEEGGTAKTVRILLPWFGGYRFGRPFCQEALHRFLESGAHRSGCGKWWADVREVHVP